MGIKLFTLKCPQCGATLNVESNKKITYCCDCGNKILLNDENEYIIRKVDEAEIKRAEAKIVQLEIKERTEIRKREDKQKKTKISFISTSIGIILVIVGSMLGSASGDDHSPFYVIALMGMLLTMVGICNIIEG